MNATLLQAIQAKRDDTNVYDDTNVTNKTSTESKTRKRTKSSEKTPQHPHESPDQTNIVKQSTNHYSELHESQDDSNEYEEDQQQEQQYEQEEFDGDIETTTSTPNPNDVHIELQSKTNISIAKQLKQKREQTKEKYRPNRTGSKLLKDFETVTVTITEVLSDSEDEGDNTKMVGDTDSDKGKKKKHKKSKDIKDKKSKKKKGKDKKSDNENEIKPKIKKPFILRQSDVLSAMKTTYRVGTICRIHSMEKQTQYNNKFGRIIGYQKSQKGGKIDIYYVKILDKFKKTNFLKANILKVEDLSEIEDIKERKCNICSCFVFLALFALIFISCAMYIYFWYRNDGWYYYLPFCAGGIGVCFMLWSIFEYLKSRFCCCCCNCCYIRSRTTFCC
eukprot:226277_1